MTPEHEQDRQDAEEDAQLAAGFQKERTQYVLDAIEDNMLPASAFKHLPWPSLDTIVGGIAAGKLWYLPMYSGMGKTTVLASLCAALVARGDRVYCLPMESTPKEWLRHLVCREVGIDPGELATGRAQERPDWHDLKRQMNDLYFSMVEGKGLWSNLFISSIPDFDAESITQALIQADDFEADWVIVDHVDHLRLSGKQSEYQVSYHGNKALRDVGKDLGLRILASSQLKDDIAKVNRLALHMMPSESSIAWGGHKRQLATGMIGGCWPLRLSGVSKEELQDYRDRKLKARDICEPNTICLGVMKHRDLGKHWGEHVYLRVENGKVEDIGQEWYTAQLQHGIYTASRL